MIRECSAALVFTMLLAGCGGEDDNPAGPGGPSSGPMSATIDGGAWVADDPYVFVTNSAALPGFFSISGTSTGASALSVLLTLYNIAGPGSYPLGVGSSVFGGIAAIGAASGGWATPGTGADGTVTITALSGTRIAGTFSFTATPSTGSAAGDRTVTDGQFDITWSGTLVALPENAGSRVSGTIGGTPFSPVNVVGLLSGGNLSISAGNFETAVGIQISSFTGAGTYPLSSVVPLRTVTVAAGSAAWGAGTGMSGTITITSSTSGRVAGTYSGTLAPTGGTTATGTIEVVGGSFDVGLL
jgi:hypothetical protein